jgi:parvulin-like peptidyl-prolyl isomerase
VLTQFGYHLLQVTGRTGDEARVRHILIPMAKSEEELARLDVRADSLVELARQMGIERAARVTGATLRRGVTVSESDPQIQGVGPALEVLNWAAGEAADGEGPANPVSDDAFEAPGAVYIAQLESYQARGRMSQEEAAPQIRRDLILEKKRARAREVGEAIVREVRGGKTLQAAATARGLTVETAGPFTRGEPNQALGQANAAIGASFGTPVGQVSSVVETTTGLFIIRPTQRTTADRKEFEAQKVGQRASTEMRRAQAMLQRYMNDLRNSAEVKDNRDRVFGRS